MGFQYTTAIEKIRNLNSKIKIIQGGTSAGKTWAILPILIDQAARNKNLVISVVSESMPHLRRGAIRDFMHIMKDTNRFFKEHWNKTLSTYTFRNGSIIEFFSANDGDKLRGSRRNILYVNECNNISLNAYTQLSSRTQSKRNFNSQIYLDYNPTHKFWIDDIKKSDNADFLILTYKDNEALSQDIIEYLEERKLWGETSDYWNNWYKVYGLGLEGSLEGTIFKDFDIIKSIPEGADFLGNGIDFGYSNDPTAIVSVWKSGDNLYFDEKVYSKKLLNKDISNLIFQHKLDSDFNVADSAEPKTIAELRSYGIKVIGVKKGKDSINHGIQLLQQHKLFITENSTNIINEFRNYRWLEHRGEIQNRPVDEYNHAIDAIRYIVTTALQTTTDADMFFLDI